MGKVVFQKYILFQKKGLWSENIFNPKEWHYSTLLTSFCMFVMFKQPFPLRSVPLLQTYRKFRLILNKQFLPLAIWHLDYWNT